MKRPFDCPHDWLPLERFRAPARLGADDDDKNRAIALHLDWKGWPRPVVIDDDGRIIHGGEYVCAMQQVAEHVPYCAVPVARLRDLTRDDRQIFDAADAHLHARASVPQSTLPPVSAKAITRAGDIWRVGRHVLMCGNSGSVAQLDQALDGESPHLTFLDPPQHLFDREDWRTHLETTLELFLAGCVRLMDGGFVVVAADWRNLNRFTAVARGLHLDHRETAMWTGGKGPDGALYKSGFRAIAFYRKGDNPHLSNCAPSEARENVFSDLCDDAHANALPPSLLRRLIEDATAPGACVLDLTAGPGFVLDAAEDTGRQACLMERSPARCDAILRRFSARGGPSPVLKSSGATFAEMDEMWRLKNRT